MTKGFITIATGDINYYRIARNLLRSYKQNGGTMPFALIADKKNEFTEEFDEVVILNNPSNSWLDKLSILNICPYDENIFIDADCLIYQNIDFFWNLFENADDFSCFGGMLPLDSEIGWFKQNEISDYKIHFITHLHGMLYFVRKSPVIHDFYLLCKDIIKNYDKIEFKMFNEKPADEPVFALAMAVMNLKPIERKPEYYCFIPFATKVISNYRTRTVRFSNPKDGYIDSCHIIHWSSPETRNDTYLWEVQKVNWEHQNAGNRCNSILYYLRFELNPRFLLYKLKTAVKIIIRR